MSGNIHYADFFWGGDFCSSRGIDTLLGKMKDGRKNCKEFEDFLKKRAKCEEDYAKSLEKLAANSLSALEIGSFAGALDQLRRNLVDVASEHSSSAKAMKEAADRISEFSEAQKNRCKQSEDRISKSLKRKKEMYQKTMESKKSYEGKCEEKELAENQVLVAQKSEIGQNPKSMDKLYMKRGKSAEEQKKAESQYHYNVDSLEVARKDWEKDMESVCQALEKFEIERMVFLRNEMWVNVNVISQSCVDIDRHNDNVRNIINECNIDSDMALFIKKNSTGTERPKSVIFEPYNTFASQNAASGYDLQEQRSKTYSRAT